MFDSVALIRSFYLTTTGNNVFGGFLFLSIKINASFFFPLVYIRFWVVTVETKMVSSSNFYSTFYAKAISKNVNDSLRSSSWCTIHLEKEKVHLKVSYKSSCESKQFMKMLHKRAKKDLGVFFDSDVTSFIMNKFYNKTPMLAVEKVWVLVMQAFYIKFSKNVLMLCVIW